MTDVIMFCLVTGILSTVALDIWVTLVEKVIGLPATNWGMVGRWLCGISRGQWVLSNSGPSTPSAAEKTLGWAFHYVVGTSYSVLIVLVWGVEFIHAPTVMPVVMVGVVISTLAGLMILMPGLGAGFMGRKLPNQGVMFAYVVVAHVVYALALYGVAIRFSTGA